MTKINQSMLEAIQMYGRVYISEQLLEMPFAKIEVALSNEMAAVCMNIRGYIYGDNIDERTIVRETKVPATWWQAFKLSAIRDGNPFFNHHKIIYQRVRLVVDMKKYWVFPEIDPSYYPEKLGKPIPFIGMIEQYYTHD